MNVKTNDYYGTHMKYCNECKKLTTIMGPMWGIAMNFKNQPLLWDLICEYYNVCIKPVVIKGPICRYCIYEMALWNL
jgi:hypothetical protein